MSWENLYNYDVYLRYVTSAVKLTGFPCTILVPNNQVNLGYETTPNSYYTPSGTSYSKKELKGFINFNPKRAVFYHNNLDPSDPQNAGLLPAFFLPNDFIKEGCFIRTSNDNGVSVWGDLIFEVIHTVDTGKFKTLVRTYFIRAISSAEINGLFEYGKQ